MIVTIGKQFVNLANMVTCDEGTGGVLRLHMVDGKAVYARAPEEIELVRAALKQLSFTPSKKKADLSEGSRP